MRSSSTMTSSGRTLITLTLGLSLAACKELPIEAMDDTGTEDTDTGDGDPGDGDPGDGDPGDGDGDPGDGDPGDGDPGDGDPDPSECGNGIVEDGEACDDGNAVEDDECTNACELPACGDGILHEAEGEVCDDGNVDPGDGCTSACQLPGAEIWSTIVDVDMGEDDIGFEVEIDSGENIDLLLTVGGSYRIAEYDVDANPVWNFASLDTERSSLEILSNDDLVVGGFIGNQGYTRVYDSSGNSVWSEAVQINQSSVFDVAVDDMDFIVAAGYAANSDTLLYRDDSMGMEQWSLQGNGGGGFGPVATGPLGQIWVVRESPRQLLAYTVDGDPGWNSVDLSVGTPQDLVVDPDGYAYLLASAQDLSLFTITKFDNTGAIEWTVMHDDPQQLELAGGLALMPGGLIVAGSTNGSGGGSDALLALYTLDGDPMIDDIVLDGDDMLDDFDAFYDVAIGDGYAVAVGSHDPAGQADSDLWLYKFEI